MSYRLPTRIVQFEPAPGDPNAPLSTPLYQTATFEQPSADELGPYDYSRSGNPTRTVLEDLVAEMEGGSRALAFASGMAAITAVTRLAGPGDAIVAGDDLYGGTYRLLSRIGETHGIEVRYVDTTDLDAVARALDERARLLLLETPTNPLLKVTDLRAAARLTRDNGTLLAVDNSIMSPYFQKPLELGADIVVESATKALSGHSDMTGGIIAVKDPELAERLYWVQNAEGAGLAPFESWLLLRSVKTLAVRLDRQAANAERVARFLRERPEVEAVHWPGFVDHPGHAIHAAQARGASVVISFATNDDDTARRIVEATEVFKISVSFGGVGSVISLPCQLSHASIPPEVRRARAIPEGLVRLSVGIEAAEDLVADLDAAFATANAGRTRSRTREVTA